MLVWETFSSTLPSVRLHRGVVGSKVGRFKIRGLSVEYLWGLEFLNKNSYPSLTPSGCDPCPTATMSDLAVPAVAATSLIPSDALELVSGTMLHQRTKGLWHMA